MPRRRGHWARQDNGSDLTTVYTYDPATGEMLTVDCSDTTPDLICTYDRYGRKKTVTDATGTRTFAYNSTLQPSTETLDSTFYSGKVITKTYQSTGTGELPGRDAGFEIGTTQDPDADAAVTYGYDACGRFGTLGWDAGTIPGNATYSYVANSNLVGGYSIQEASAMISIARAYESTRDLVDYVQNSVDAAVVSKYDYTNDAIGRRTDAVMTGSAFSQSTFNTYGYNDRSEVTSGAKYVGTDTSDFGNPVTSYDYDYAYDPIGNRKTCSDAGAATSYTANQLNQYTAVTGLSSPVHDDDGNMTLMPDSAGDWTLTWNGENRLVEAVKTDETKLVFAYDYMGRRVRRQVYTRTAGQWQLGSDLIFVYDGWNVVLELDATDSNAVEKTRIWGLDLSRSLQGAGGVGGLVAVIDKTGTSPASYYATYDANGNVSEYLDAAGTVAAHYEYSPFGRTTVAGGNKADDFVFRFSTKYLDDDTGLYYYGHRYYNSELGRWINRDPIGEKGGPNLFGFVTNSPPVRWDLLGREPKTCSEMYARIRSRFQSVLDIPPATSSEAFLTPSVRDQVSYTGVETAVYVFRTHVSCTSANGKVGPIGDFYAMTHSLSSGHAEKVDFLVAVGTLSGELTKGLYSYGYSSSTYPYKKPCCQCDVSMVMASVIHGHSVGSGPSDVDKTFTSDEKSWVIFQKPPAGIWMKQAWRNGVEYPPEPL